jgi:hypothetical protein
MFFAHERVRNNNWHATNYSSKKWDQRFSVAGHLSNRATIEPNAVHLFINHSKHKNAESAWFSRKNKEVE